jgi:V/A-type H+-transporting ATPase subunit I
MIFANPLFFIIAAAAIGFVHVNIAHAYAFMQGIETKNWGVIVAKIGFFAMEIFAILWAVTLAGVYPPFASMAKIFEYGTYGGLLGLIAGIIIQVKAFGVLMWIFEITGLIGDILSYTRLAGVGMAGAYLGAAINLLANIFKTLIPGPIGLFFGIIAAVGVLLLGHGINIVLSIQGGFVHSMRLCLVEFMFKFYEGGGSKYNPFGLKTSRSLIIKQKA